MDARGSWRPPDVPPAVWDVILRRQPGCALAVWFEAHLGLEPETEGDNRGPWLRSVLRGGDGLPWCADAVMSGLHLTGGPTIPAFAAGKHPYWHNRSVRNMRDAFRRVGHWQGRWVAPQRGDLVFWNRSGRWHVDVCAGFSTARRGLVCIGGNVGDGIAKTVTGLGNPDIDGFGRIAWSLNGNQGLDG